jgi:toxin ParE1/3/4
VELRWTPSALADLDSARAFFEERNLKAAVRIANRLEEAVSSLKPFPALGRGGRLRGTREIVVSGTPLIVIYRVRENQVQIVRVLHHARKWP